MIALLHGLPLISLPNGHSFSFQKSWVKNTLQTLASKHGYGCWWFAGELAESVELYLQKERTGNVITIVELESIIKELLLSLRFSDLAAAFFLPPPPTTLSLLELAQQAGAGYELVFFQLLKQRLEKVTTSSVQQLEVYDLDASVRHLCHRKRLKSKETKLQIVNYIRTCSTLTSLLAKKDPSKNLEVTII